MPSILPTATAPRSARVARTVGQVAGTARRRDRRDHGSRGGRVDERRLLRTCAGHRYNKQ